MNRQVAMAYGGMSAFAALAVVVFIGSALGFGASGGEEAVPEAAWATETAAYDTAAYATEQQEYLNAQSAYALQQVDEQRAAAQVGAQAELEQQRTAAQAQIEADLAAQQQVAQAALAAQITAQRDAAQTALATESAAAAAEAQAALDALVAQQQALLAAQVAPTALAAAIVPVAATAGPTPAAAQQTATPAATAAAVAAPTARAWDDLSEREQEVIKKLAECENKSGEALRECQREAQKIEGD